MKAQHLQEAGRLTLQKMALEKQLDTDEVSVIGFGS